MMGIGPADVESGFRVRLYAALLGVFRGINLRKSAMTKDDFDDEIKPPKEVMEFV